LSIGLQTNKQTDQQKKPLTTLYHHTEYAIVNDLRRQIERFCLSK